ncbi:MAG: LamG-like jellyroll fold domain-containing protein [Verrucomicrobiota bacterium]
MPSAPATPLRRRALLLTGMLVFLTLGSVRCLAHEWHDMSNIPTERQELPGVFLEGKIYALGGMLETPRFASTTAFERYDVATDTWETLPDLPVSVHHVNAAVLNGKVYLMGGWTGSGPDAVLDVTYEFDPTTNLFTQYDDMPNGVAAAAAVAHNGAIYVLGGTEDTSYTGSGNVDLVQRFDPSATSGTQWTTVSMAMPDPRNHVHAVVMDDAIYVSPGRSVTNGSRDWEGVTIQKFYPLTNLWENPLNLAELPANRGRSAGGLAAINRLIYFIGGEANDSPTSLIRLPMVDQYDPATNVWTALAPEMPIGVHGMSAVTADDRSNKIYVIAGGTGLGVAPTPKVQRMTVHETQPPFSGSVPMLPGKIEIEDYDTGGSGVGHLDMSVGNSPGAYRTDYVDIATTADAGGGFKVSDTEVGEWLEFTTNLTLADLHRITLRAASTGNDAKIAVWLDGIALGEIPITNTGTLETFADHTLDVDLNEAFIGSHALLRLEVLGAGADLNWIEFTSIDPIGPEVDSHAATNECTVEVLFSEPVESGSGSGGAENPANYSIDFGISVESAQLAADRRTVVLTTSPLSPGVNYALTVSNVRDLASIPNPINPPAALAFNYEDRIDSDLVLLYPFEERYGAEVSDLSGFGAPLHLSTSNSGNISWLPGALRINSDSLLTSSAPATKASDAIEASRALTLEAWIQPANTSQSGPARIATLSLNSGARNVTLGQDGDRFEVRLRTDSTGPNGDSPSLSTNVGTATTDLIHVVYTRDSSGSAMIYLNGNLSASAQIGTAGQPLGWNNGYHFGIGDEITGTRPWLGDLHLVALYSRALSGIEVLQNYDAGPRGGNLGIYESWRRRHFTEAELANPLVSGDTADPDGDEVINIVEGANLLDPKSIDTPFDPAIHFDPAGFYTVEFDRPFYTDDLVQGAEFSSDLQNWSMNGVFLSPPVDNGNGTWRFMVRDPEDTSSSYRRFSRHTIRRAK